MKVLLDTHVVIWWLAGDKRLNGDVKELIDHEPDVFLSAASIWEAAVKQALGKLPGPADLPERMIGAGLRMLPMTARHGLLAGRLPALHRDPFDRMLVAQAVAEDLTLATHDPQVQRYDVALLKL